MEQRTDRVLTWVSTACLVVLVGLIIRREFVDPPPPAPLAPPTFVNSWDRILQNSRHVAGDSTSEVVLLEFTDLQCPACKRFHEHELPALLGRFGARISVRVAHLPLRSHPQAMKAEMAADCAAAQGRFAEFVAAAFARQADLARDSIWSSLAREARVPDARAFSACLEQNDTSAVVASRTLADDAGIRATPTLLINGWRDLAVPVERSLRTAISAAIDSLRDRER